MNAPGPATAAVVERSGPRAAIALGLVIYVVVVGGLWACGSDDALYPVVTAGGRGERMVQQAFFGLVVVLALGWNFMWLASTSALDAAAQRRRVNHIVAARRWRRVDCAIAATPARRRGSEVHPTHWMIYPQALPRSVTGAKDPTAPTQSEGGIDRYQLSNAPEVAVTLERHSLSPYRLTLTDGL